MSAGDGLIKYFADAIFGNVKEIMPAAKSIIEVGLQMKRSAIPDRVNPYFNAISKIYVASNSLRELFEIQNQLMFLHSIHKGNIELEGFAKRQEALHRGEAWVYREVERLAIYLSRNTDTFKAKLQAQLYLDYIGNTITEDKFQECLDIIDQMIIHDINHLLEIRKYEEKEEITISEFQSYQKKTGFDYKLIECHRLSALGLVVPVSGFSFAATTPRQYILTELGIYICNIIETQNESDQ